MIINRGTQGQRGPWKKRKSKLLINWEVWTEDSGVLDTLGWHSWACKWSSLGSTLELKKSSLGLPHVDGQQKPTQRWKAIILQLKISKFLQEAEVIEKQVQVSPPVASGAVGPLRPHREWVQGPRDWAPNHNGAAKRRKASKGDRKRIAAPQRQK